MSPTANTNPVDVLIVGAGGASGATVAKVLTEAGLRVVGLERGPWLKPEHFSGDEIKFINRNYLWPDPVLKPRTVRRDETSPAEVTQFSPMPQIVGGGTIHYSGWFPRATESDFRMRSLHGDVDGASLADWPFSYDDLEPYYTKVEWEFGVSGVAGANKYEARRSAGYPCPPPPLSRYGKVFYDTCAKLGYNAFPMPQAFVTKPYKGRTPLTSSGFVQQFGDPTSGKSTTQSAFTPDAIATGRYDLRPDCYVHELTLTKEGRVKGALYEDPDGHMVEQEAAAVIVCCGAIESARLLLASSSNLFPNGLANSSGQLGRNATFHEYFFAIGLFDRELHDPLYGWAGNYVNGTSLEFYETDENRGHIAGCVITASGLGPPVNWTFPGRPTWGSAAKDADRDFFNHSMKLGVLLNDLPRETNRVDLDPDVKDAWGQPVARITHTNHPNDVVLGNWQVNKNMEILEAAGASKILPVYFEQTIGNACHQHGTARMGNDPATSVLDKWGRAHDVDNLYVLDGSGFPTGPGVNPTLTIMANAWRCAEHIAEFVAKGRSEAS
jgi:choline dehydrogenase-like flavoprotein